MADANPFAKFAAPTAAAPSTAEPNPFAKFKQAPPEAAEPKPAEPDAPRWDVLGDIWKAAKDSYGALREDVANAFSTERDKAARAQGIGPELAHEAGKFGSAVKMVPDALGMLASPLTGTAHALGGSALSYLPGVTKRQADQGVDTALMGLAPGRGMPTAPFGEINAARRAGSVAEKGAAKVLKRFDENAKAGGLTAQQALDDINKSSSPKMLADVGGEPVRALGGNVARQPGPARAVADRNLTQRDQGAPARIDAEIDKRIAGGPSMFQTAKALVQARSGAARPLYEAMEKLQNIWSPRLQQFLDSPEIQKGLARGFNLERIDALAEGRTFDPTQMGVDLDAEGNIKLVRAPNMRVLDIAKRGLDAMIGDERNDFGQLSTNGRSYEKLRRAYIGEIDALDKDGLYRQARQAWSGPSASLDALTAGKAIFQGNRTGEEIAAEFNALSPGDQEFYRVGVADKLRERLHSAGLSSDESKAIIRSEMVKRQLAPIFRSAKEYDAFVDTIADERQMHGTKTGTLGGSATAKRLAEDESADLPDLHEWATIGHTLSKGNVTGAIAQTLVKGWRAMRDKVAKPDPEVNEWIARALFTPNLSKMSETGQRLMRLPQGVQPPSVMGVRPPRAPAPPPAPPPVGLPQGLAAVPSLAGAINPPIAGGPP